MSQFLRPSSDASVSSTWHNNGAGFWQSLDEVSASDADYCWNDNNTANAISLKLSAATTPSAGTCTVRYRVAKTNSGTVVGTGAAVSITAYVQKGPGGTIVATDAPRSLSGTWTTYTWTPNLAGITDWTDVRVGISTSASGASGPRGGAVSWIELEVPNAPGANGSLAATEVTDSFASTGTVSAGISGSLAATGSSDTAAMVGVVIVKGVLASTESQDRFNSPSLQGPVGILSAREPGDSAAFRGVAVIPPIDGVPYACERCGSEYPLSQLRKEWTGLYVCRKDYDPKPAELAPPRVTPEGIPKIAARNPQDDNSLNTTQPSDL